MTYEVEMKYAVADQEELLEKLERQFGLHFDEPVEEQDTFYQHPARDYAAADECLRIRRRAGRYKITYKGSKIDRETKTRREIELYLTDDPETAKEWDALLHAIGFRAVAELTKTRRTAELVEESRNFVLTLDHIDGLGDFMELETLAGEERLDDARNRLRSLAAILDLHDPIRTSYLELLQTKLAGK